MYEREDYIETDVSTFARQRVRCGMLAQHTETTLCDKILAPIDGRNVDLVVLKLLGVEEMHGGKFLVQSLGSSTKVPTDPRPVAARDVDDPLVGGADDDDDDWLSELRPARAAKKPRRRGVGVGGDAVVDALNDGEYVDPLAEIVADLDAHLYNELLGHLPDEHDLESLASESDNDDVPLPAPMAPPPTPPASPLPAPATPPADYPERVPTSPRPVPVEVTSDRRDAVPTLVASLLTTAELCDQLHLFIDGQWNVRTREDPESPIARFCLTFQGRTLQAQCFVKKSQVVQDLAQH